MTKISIVTTWLCATGVAVISSYCVLTNHKNNAEGQKRAAEVASSRSKKGTIPDYIASAGIYLDSAA